MHALNKAKKDYQYKICRNCVMDTSDCVIVFDDNGVCKRCNDYYNYILPKWNKGVGKEGYLAGLINRIRESGKGKAYDCLLGLSGGLDSSYMLHLAVREFALRPLVIHVDAGWDMPFVRKNIEKLVMKLAVDLKIEQISSEEMRNFQLAMFKSGVPHLDIPQDMAFASVLDKYASKFGIKYILNGGNISTEVVVNPNSWGYWGTDMRQINDILNKYGTIPMKTYPFTNVFKRKMLIPYVKRIKTLKLLNFVPYVKKDTEKLLKDEYDWESYPQKHFESLLTKFIEGYWLPKRFGYDVRRPQFSSLILTEQMSRQEALIKLQQPPIPEEEGNFLFKTVSDKLQISTDELRSYMKMPLKIYKDYKNCSSLIYLGSRLSFLFGVDKLIRK